MVTTVLEARVEPERWDELERGYEQIVAQLPPQLLASHLLQGQSERTLWRISTVWVSMEGLREYRNSVETPDGVRLFREVGALPTLSVFEVVSHAEPRSSGSVATESGDEPTRMGTEPRGELS